MSPLTMTNARGGAARIVLDKRLGFYRNLKI